jgi:hypothetical protein
MGWDIESRYPGLMISNRPERVLEKKKAESQKETLPFPRRMKNKTRFV